MNAKVQWALCATIMIGFASGTRSASAQATTFTYQGRLTVSGGLATGVYDLRFSLWDAATGPAQVGGTVTNAATAVSDGLFTVTLDFGSSVFTGSNRWLEISVRTNGIGAFNTLTPRQPVTPTPYAIYAAGAGALNGLSATNFALASGSSAYVAKTGDTMTGTLNLPANGFVAGGNQLVLSGGNVGIGTVSPTAKLDIAGTVRATSFQGDGSGLTGVGVSGSAGGDLAGTYPNPTIANSAVTGAKIAAGQVVKSLNSLRDAVLITAGANVTVATVGNALQISSTGATLPSLGIKSGVVSGSVNNSAYASVTVTFGTAYPNSSYAVLLTGQTYVSGGLTVKVEGTVTSKSSTGFTAYIWAPFTSSTTVSCNWMTVPYTN